jgi:hypothetical protein
MTFNCGLCEKKHKQGWHKARYQSMYELLEHLWHKHHFDSRREDDIMRRLLQQAEAAQL